MLNNFCFQVYAQNSLFIPENCNDFFWDIIIWDIITLSPDIRVHIAGSQLKMSERQTKAGNQEFCKTCKTGKTNKTCKTL